MCNGQSRKTFDNIVINFMVVGGQTTSSKISKQIVILWCLLMFRNPVIMKLQ